MLLENLVFSLNKRYSLPVLILLYVKDGLTFDQIYDLSVELKSDTESAGSNALSSGRGKYGAVSRESINRAVKELTKMKYVKKEARMVGEKAHTTYVLTEKTRKFMDKYFTIK